MLTASLENHTRMRRMFSPAFSDRAIKSQEPLFKQ
jgi:cytochrome P450